MIGGINLNILQYVTLQEILRHNPGRKEYGYGVEWTLLLRFGLWGTAAL